MSILLSILMGLSVAAYIGCHILYVKVLDLKNRIMKLEAVSNKN